MMRSLLVITTLFFSISGEAQKILPMGRWEPMEIQKDSIMIFDRTKPEVSFKAALKNRLKYTDELTEADSLEIKADVDRTFALMEQMFYEFRDENLLTVGTLDFNEEGEYAFVEKEGGYHVDGDRLFIRVDGRLDEYVYSVEAGDLILVPVIGGEVYQKGYVKCSMVE